MELRRLLVLFLVISGSSRPSDPLQEIDPLFLQQLLAQFGLAEHEEPSFSDEKSTESAETSAVVLQFKDDCTRYTIEPGWVMKQLLAMQVDEFSAAWSWFTTFFFLNQKVTQKERPKILLYCKEFDTFLQNLVVTQDKSLALEKKNGSLSIFQHWAKKQYVDYTHFYAFYFDCKAADFIEALNNAFLEGSTTIEGKRLAREALQHFTLLYTLFRQLEKTEYDEQYASYLKRYGELFSLLAQDLQEGEWFL